MRNFMMEDKKHWKEAKKIIRNFMRTGYTDERLIMLLDHARSGKLSFYSCCCFVGVSTAKHELRGKHESSITHGITYSEIPNGTEASSAYNILFYSMVKDWSKYNGDLRTEDATRRRILIPMILAEIKRRKIRCQTTFQDVEMLVRS